MRLFIIVILLFATACGTTPEELTAPSEPTEPTEVRPVDDDTATEAADLEIQPASRRETGPIVELVSVSEDSDDLYIVTADIRADVIATSWWLGDGTKLAHGPIAEIELTHGWHRLLVVARTEGGEFALDSRDLSIP